MNSTRKCVSCSSTQLFRIPAFPGEGPRIAVGEIGMHVVEISRYVCRNCGFIEQRVEDLKQLCELQREYDSDSEVESR